MSPKERNEGARTHPTPNINTLCWYSMNIPYDLKKPRKTYKLPKKYREISGICPLPGIHALAFVQDEAVRVYLFNLISQKITKYTKHTMGDAEDIVIIGNTAYILTAGKRPAVYRVVDFMGGSQQYDRYDLKLNKKYDPEGLCHDPVGNRLLIACKGSPTKGDTQRKIFSFETQSGRRGTAPILTINYRDFVDKGEGSFNPSGIAIHPITNDVYMIGTKGAAMLVCCGWDGSIKGVARLDKDRFEQPEGIAFTASGELIICSEGAQGKKARILLFTFIA